MITIPKPCHENWNEMTPKEKGRLCDKCCKVVVDFRNKTAKQIVDFLQDNIGQKVCGRFNSQQVSAPVITSQRRMRRSHVFAAALMFVFGSMLFTSCKGRHHDPEVMGKIAPREANFIGGPGDTARMDSAVKKGAKGKVCPIRIEEPKYELMGDVAYIPEADTLK